MVITTEVNHNGFSNGSLPNGNGGFEEKVDELRRLLGKVEGDPLRIVGVGAGAWGSVFTAMLQEGYGSFREKVLIRIWRRPGRTVDRATAEHLFEVINSREDVLRRLIRRCAYLKYVEARLGDRTLNADEILKDGFCLNMIDTPLCPLKVVTNLQEAVWDADIVINGLPSTETREVFEEISKYWKERITVPVIISLAKGSGICLLTDLHREVHILSVCIFPLAFALFISMKLVLCESGVPMENILYLGGPNIASEIYNKEYANARICGAEKWRKPLAKFLRQPHFIVWDNGDLVTHEVMGGLKNVYAIGAGMVAALTNESATSKSVYFAHCTSEMVFITHLLAEEPEKLAGPLLADTYGVSAVKAFYELLSQPSLNVLNPEENKHVAPVKFCPILKMLHKILIIRESPPEAILQALRDETMNDPRDRIEIAQSHVFYRPSLLVPTSKTEKFPEKTTEMSLVDYASSSDDEAPDLVGGLEHNVRNHNGFGFCLFSLLGIKFSSSSLILLRYAFFKEMPLMEKQKEPFCADSLTKSGSPSDQQPEKILHTSPPSIEKLPDASLLLNSPAVSSNLMNASDHSSRVAAALAENASRKRDSNGLASSTLRSKVPRGNLPPSRSVPDTSGGMLVPPQLKGRLVVIY
ncbi:putative glycerol-3-phosphate dehydrogenase [NAD(+)] 1, cytosolic [Senna tora]|uniref:Putative glycerol-3-phosphate dehydrogenase [NAD(+)] 1, cytosolic n=1 Tax=Senna tora TaxID=362788 RepID=A0A835CEN8_9FABA|nr:putative glycerol-3-phosphate dehydrogenase [NAD(+)] 1, cytosolic [Senna tora]